MSNPTFWNERYRAGTYAYGTAPNAFFRQIVDGLPAGKLLLPAEGEGRNAVYAARLGWEVHAFDFSEAAREKALSLARKEGVGIRYRLAEVSAFPFLEEQFDLIALIYAHLPSAARHELHQACWGALLQGGHLLLEGFAKEQIGRDSGGPKNPDFMLSKSDIDHDFPAAEKLILTAQNVQLDEGPFHQGEAAVIRFLGRKK